MTRILAALLFLTPAMAECDSVTLPPPQYDYVLPYNPVIRIVNFWDVPKVCAQLGFYSRDRLWGCYAGRVIVIPAVDDWNIDLICQRRIFRHERGHLEGWPADHPRARYSYRAAR
jgi:hypothetical protein